MRRLAIIAMMACAALCRAQDIECSVAILANASTGEFAPYMIGSWNNGRMTQRNSLLLDASAVRAMDTTARWSYGYGFELIGGPSSKNYYDYWSVSDKHLISRKEGSSPFWFQQFYGEFKYRGAYITIGLKNQKSALLNNDLSSGDLTESNNARPIPQVRVGFLDFQDIPYTRGWVQIQGELSYGKMLDNNYLKNHYNYYSYHINLGAHYSYKRCYFRTNAAKPLSLTFGMQAATLFGGETTTYVAGRQTSKVHYSNSLATMVKVLLPVYFTGEDYFTGSTLGSWDFMLRYRIGDDTQVKAYLQKPWEDGSGIGMKNKTDGLWGLEYQSSPWYLDGIVVEYLDFRDQGGPLHWAPGDFDNTTISSSSKGRDNYYNNHYFNSYANYGMSLGTPFLLSPLYNLDGYPAFASNRAKGVHVGLTGAITPRLRYKALGSYQKAFGTYNVPFYRPKTCTSFMIQADWQADCLLPGLAVRGQVACDRGTLRGNNFGASLSVKYTLNVKE